jgi:hypothetical protein
VGEVSQGRRDDQRAVTCDLRLAYLCKQTSRLRSERATAFRQRLSTVPASPLQCRNPPPLPTLYILTRSQKCKEARFSTGLKSRANVAQGGVQRHLSQSFAEAWRGSILRLWLWLEARKRRRNVHLRPVTNSTSAVESSSTRI